MPIQHQNALSTASLELAIASQVADFRAEYEAHATRLRSSCGEDSECTQRAEEEALMEAVAFRADSIGADGTALHDAIVSSGDSEVRSLLLVRYRQATDRAERLAALQILLRTRELDPRRLEDELMLRFFEAAASDAERGTLLELHRVVGVSAAVGPLLADWCLVAKRADELHCLAALGHRDTATDFRRVFDHLRVTPSRSLAMHGGDAVGRCGEPCSDIVAELATSTVAWDRHAAYFAAARSEYQMLRDTLATSIDVGSISEDEAVYVERALGLEWQDYALRAQGEMQ